MKLLMNFKRTASPIPEPEPIRRLPLMVLFKSAEEYVKRQSKTFVFICSIIIILLVGGADYITGEELSLVIFYIFPISLVAWFTNRNATILLCIISSIVEFASNAAAGRTYSHYLISFWNSALLLGFFLLYALILSMLQKEYRGRIKLIDELQGSLAELKQTREELEQKSQDLARSNMDLKQFAYAASHDLQAPLRGVEGFVNLFSRRYKGKLDTNADEFIGYIIDGVKRMQVLIKDLLEYSQIGAKEIHWKPMESKLAVTQALANLKTAIEESSAIVTYEALPRIIGDSSQLSSLFQNLIGNAIKYRKEEPPKIHIAAERKGDAWLFSVRDNGIGIDPDNSDRIFVVFQRLHTTEAYEGTGIGLAICKRIVERHHGDIWVASEPGKGSTFYFTIPDQEVNF
jgi:signal transduction histidine kinase